MKHNDIVVGQKYIIKERNRRPIRGTVIAHATNVKMDGWMTVVHIADNDYSNTVSVTVDGEVMRFRAGYWGFSASKPHVFIVKSKKQSYDNGWFDTDEDIYHMVAPRLIKATVYDWDAQQEKKKEEKRQRDLEMELYYKKQEREHRAVAKRDNERLAEYNLSLSDVLSESEMREVESGEYYNSVRGKVESTLTLAELLVQRGTIKKAM